MAEVNNSTTSKNFETATRGFCSCVDGEKYIDFLIVMVSSYKKHNDMPIDWIVICKDEDSLEHIKSMTEFLTDDTVKMVYTVMPTPPKEVDYKLYINPFKRALNNSVLYCKLIYFIDLWKNKYDLLICVDLDIIFINNIKQTIEDFFNSDCTIGGMCEPYDKRLNSTLFKKPVQDPKFLSIDNFVNFGFAMLNTKYLRDDNYFHFLEISKGVEDQFFIQAQSYFAYEYQNSIKFYKYLQLCIYEKTRIMNLNKYKMIHFTNDTYLWESMENFDYDMLFHARYIITVLFFKQYVSFALTCNISDKFRKILKENLVIYCKKVTPSIIKKARFSYCI